MSSVSRSVEIAHEIPQRRLDRGRPRCCISCCMWLASTAVIVTLVASCGGEAVLDSELQAAACEVPPPDGRLLSCHGAVGIGDDGTTCTNACFDESQNEYTSQCSGDRCECWYQDVRICECHLARSADGSCPSRPCCPPPWQ